MSFGDVFNFLMLVLRQCIYAALSSYCGCCCGDARRRYLRDAGAATTALQFEGRFGALGAAAVVEMHSSPFTQTVLGR